MDADPFWRGKKVLITGINGFIGGNLAKALLAAGADISGLIRNHAKNTFLFIEGLSDKCTLVDGDLCDKELLARIVAEQMVNVIFHLAAQVEVGVGLANPYLTWETNVRGTYTLLEAVRQHPQHVQAVIVASTDKAYGPYARDQMPYREDYPLRPRYPYDTSKACGDMIAQAYASEVHKLPVAVTRFCNIFGPGQMNFSAIFPDAITSALGYSTFTPRGNGQQIRDFIYVEDVVDLYLTMARHVAEDPERYRGEVFNAGTNTAHSMREVVTEIYSLCGNKNDLEQVLSLMEGKTTSGEIDCQYMDFDKVNRYFGWSPRHNFRDGLMKTIAWFEDYHRRRSSTA